MRKFVQSGGAFMVVALLCFATDVLSDKGAVFIGVGAFWLVMAMQWTALRAAADAEH